MISLQLWSIEQSESGSGTVSLQQVSFEDLQLHLSEAPSGSITPGSWTTRVVLIYTNGLLLEAKDTIDCLIEAYEFAQLEAFTAVDTVNFNSTPPERRNDNDSLSNGEPLSRSYSISDNTFGVCWRWDPSKCLTTGLMYGSPGEGFTQMEHILYELPKHHQMRVNPVLIGLLTLEIEVQTMRVWVGNQCEALTHRQLLTGHHGYANTTRTTDLKGLDLANLSRDICGMAFNIGTSALCLKRIIKLADFLLEECEIEPQRVNGVSPQHGQLIERFKGPPGYCRTRIHIAKRQADGLHDEAESWKQKANILVQTVFTLTTQRDQELGIQIASDSRTLAQEAKRDSTSMKAIAAVTMSFLPGTFVASLFAMPMFDWNAPTNDYVSSRFWIYWAVTVPLTFAVLAIWLLWTNYEQVVRNISARFFDQRQEKASTNDMR